MSSRIRPFVGRYIKFFHLDTWIRLLLLCVLVGVVAGLGGCLFDLGLKYVKRQVYATYVESQTSVLNTQNILLVLGVPTAGIFISWLLAHLFAPEARGHGSDAVIRAFHRNKGFIRPRVPLLKGICTILTIGSGGSAGKEGPIAQIGAGFGSFLGQKLGLSVRDRRILMLSGCAGGIGAVLGTPLGGALFAAEFLYRGPDFEHDVVIPSVISSVTAYSIFSAIMGHQPIFFMQLSSGAMLQYPSVGGRMFVELMHYGVLSLVCAVVALLMVKGMLVTRNQLFNTLPVPEFTKPIIGGLLLGMLALIAVGGLGLYPDQVLAGETGFIQSLLKDALNVEGSMAQFSIKVLVIGVLFKIIGTALTINSGGSGGVLFPTLFIGAMTGAAYAKLTTLAWLPSWLQLTPEARAGMIMVGMGGLFCGCTKTPIASLVMVAEMTGSYGLSVPLMLVCASTYLLTTSFTINQEQVEGIADSPAHRGDFLVNVLEDLKVRDAIDESIQPQVIPADMRFSEVLEQIKNSPQTTFPIVDDAGYLVGVFSLSDIRQIMNEQSVGNLVVAGDLGTTNVMTVMLETNLSEALSMFTQYNINVLPVVEPLNSSRTGSRMAAKKVKTPRGMVGCRRVCGLLTRHDLIAAYRKRILQIEQEERQDSIGVSVFEEAQESRDDQAVALIPFLQPEKNPKETDVAEVNPPDRLGEDIFNEPEDDRDKRKRQSDESMLD